MPSFSCQRSSALNCLRLLKRGGHFTEGEGVAIVERSGPVGFEALAVEARGVGAVEIGHGVAPTDVFDGRVDARDGGRVFHLAEVNLWFNAAEVVVVTTDQGALAGKLNLLSIAEGQAAPGRIDVRQWLADGPRLNGLC